MEVIDRQKGTLLSEAVLGRLFMLIVAFEKAFEYTMLKFTNRNITGPEFAVFQLTVTFIVIVLFGFFKKEELFPWKDKRRQNILLARALISGNNYYITRQATYVIVYNIAARELSVHSMVVLLNTNSIWVLVLYTTIHRELPSLLECMMILGSIIGIILIVDPALILRYVFDSNEYIPATEGTI